MNAASTPSPLRLRALLGLLAHEEGQLVAANSEDLRRWVRWYRGRFELWGRRDLDAFLSFAGLTSEEFLRHIRTYADVGAALDRHRGTVDERTPRYVSIFSVTDWLILREESIHGPEDDSHSSVRRDFG